MARANSIRATVIHAWWNVDPDNEVTPSVRIVLPDKTEIVLRDQIANGWTVESMMLDAGVDGVTGQRDADADDSFHARYGADAEFDFVTLQQVRSLLMQQGSEFFQKEYAQSIALRNVKLQARSSHRKRG